MRGRLVSQAHQPLARPPPTSQGAVEETELPLSLSQLRARWSPRGGGGEGMRTLQRQASPEVPTLPRSSQRTISWSAGTKWVLARQVGMGWTQSGQTGDRVGCLPRDAGVWAGLQDRGLAGSQGKCQVTCRCDTHCWACISRLAGWGCLHIQGRSWGREGGSSVAPPCPHSAQPATPVPVGSPSPLTAAACIAWGTCITRGLAIRVQEAGV